MLVFSCLSEVEINGLKTSWRAGFADKHSKTQTAPLATTTQLSQLEQHALSFFYVQFLAS